MKKDMQQQAIEGCKAPGFKNVDQLLKNIILEMVYMKWVLREWDVTQKTSVLNKFNQIHSMKCFCH